MLENKTCYKTGRVSTRDFTVNKKNCQKILWTNGAYQILEQKEHGILSQKVARFFIQIHAPNWNPITALTWSTVLGASTWEHTEDTWPPVAVPRTIKLRSVASAALVWLFTPIGVSFCCFVVTSNRWVNRLLLSGSRWYCWNLFSSGSSVLDRFTLITRLKLV